MPRSYLIVGHCSGIGRALAERLLADGHQVLGISRRTSDISHGALSERQADIVTADLSTLDLPSALDGVVYAPGSINLKAFRAMKEQDFLEDFRINTLGAARVLQATSNALKAGSSPSALLFSTVAVQQGMPFHSSVAMAKGAVEGLTRALAAEWAPTIRVNAIAPSLTDTPLAARLLSNEERVQASRDRHPLKAIGRAEDIAALGAFLLSEEARWITGQILGVDGGLSSVRL